MLSTLKRKITISLIPPETLTLPLQFKKALYHVLLFLRNTHFFTNVSGNDAFLSMMSKIVYLKINRYSDTNLEILNEVPLYFWCFLFYFQQFQQQNV